MLKYVLFLSGPYYIGQPWGAGQGVLDLRYFSTIGIFKVVL